MMEKGCKYCGNVVAIGEGDHLCYECGTEKPLMVISDYIPTDDYLACDGKKFEEG